MKAVLASVLVVACLWAAPRNSALAQSNGGQSGSGQNPPASNTPNSAPGNTPNNAPSNAPSSAPNSAPADNRNAAPAGGQPHVNTQTNQNPFPEDTDSVPVMPNRNSPEPVPGLEEEAGEPRIPMPVADLDPVRSPEGEAAAEFNGEKDSSSSLAGMDNLLPPDDDTQPTKRDKNGQVIEPEHQESAKEDESVGSYYLDNKNWKGALSRFESALVLDPDNPDVYWGLAECQRHLGDFADARANYLKVEEYDPGSRHAKEARKALEDPEIANAKAAAPAATPSQ